MLAPLKSAQMLKGQRFMMTLFGYSLRVGYLMFSKTKDRPIHFMHIIVFLIGLCCHAFMFL